MLESAAEDCWLVVGCLRARARRLAFSAWIVSESMSGRFSSCDAKRKEEYDGTLSLRCVVGDVERNDAPE